MKNRGKLILVLLPAAVETLKDELGRSGDV